MRIILDLDIIMLTITDIMLNMLTFRGQIMELFLDLDIMLTITDIMLNMLTFRGQIMELFLDLEIIIWTTIKFMLIWLNFMELI